MAQPGGGIAGDHVGKLPQCRKTQLTVVLPASPSSITATVASAVCYLESGT